MTPHDLTCEEMVELVTDYLEDKLPEAERASFEVHLGKCRGCTNYLDQIRKTIDLTGKLSEDGLADDVREKLLDVFRDWRKNSHER